MKKTDRFNFWFNAFILVGMLSAVLYVNIFKAGSADESLWKTIIFTVGAVMGVCNTVLSANGNILTFVFGVLDVAICAWTNLDSGNIGIFLQHILYFLPMQFVGIWQWRKRGAHKGHKVRARRLSGRQWLYVAAAAVLGTALCFGILYWIDAAQLKAGRIESIDSAKIALDASVVVLNIIGQVLLSLAFAEQWYIWTAVNVFSILLWINRLMSPGAETYTAVMLIKYCFYLLNSLNGIRIWLKLSHEAPEAEISTESQSCC